MKTKLEEERDEKFKQFLIANHEQIQHNVEIFQARQQAKKNLKREIVNPKSYGGQSCGLPNQQKVKLVSDELNFSIEIGYHRSQIKNYELARTLAELTIDELIK